MTSNLNGFDITLPAIILEKMTLIVTRSWIETENRNKKEHVSTKLIYGDCLKHSASGDSNLFLHFCELSLYSFSSCNFNSSDLLRRIHPFLSANVFKIGAWF